ncbi:MAG: GNAT family N-acetyltransferase [Cellulomonas sp.]|uniref:Phosphinothricin N-acetyltransferase n=1 Tax=Cellulomonas gelida TaxID=1712 RepID=A0A4Y3KSQ0_9CELL|nr:MULTISPECIES: GNAT family N-acetyltransferase [Cellulomonas]MCR6648556.1 GNAT family N-acetyltransferase [Cellulomonas sp.]MCR6704500.1 GNAT family N-acetyltransferase [Cellulomonas sp.]GEA85878.1 phosphinothricin N-acetyltransferase [Cellulomonas gelida]GGL32356.1 phosphinothricin N-acetyltransferase [Cellulomonas gelida]
MTTARTDVRLAPMTSAHADAVLSIYSAGIATGLATFTAHAPTWTAFDEDHLAEHRLVALDPDARVLGWVAASPVSGRCVYSGVVEASVYVDDDARGRGVGRALLDGLLDSAQAAGVWTVQSGVFPQNRASLALHEAAGFRVVGTRERLGLMSHGPLAGSWLDVVLLEKRL